MSQLKAYYQETVVPKLKEKYNYSNPMQVPRIEKVVVNGKTTYDFSIFREGSKHVIGMYDEINSFVSYVKDAAQGGSSKEMAFVLVGEPGNGKTFFVEFLCNKYREFVSLPVNRKYTFRFVNLERLGV
mgnify:CR=1 FL=1